MAIKVGDRVWVQLRPKEEKDGWILGFLMEKYDKGKLRVCLEGGEEVVVPFNRVSRWTNSRIQLKNGAAIPAPVPVVPDLELLSNESRRKAWLAKIEANLGVSVAADSAAVLVLLPHGAIADNPAPSWKEMAMIGDALWHSYLRIVLIGRGYRNGDVAKTIGRKGWETRRKLAVVGQRLSLNSLLPILAGKLHDGETAEAFLGWAYTFGGEEAYRTVAQKYLEVLEK